jgi:hypothetical protein
MAEDLGHLLLHPRGAREQRRDHGLIRDLAAISYSVAKLGNRGDPIVDGALAHLETPGEGLVGGTQHAGVTGNFGILRFIDGWTSAGHGDAP